MNLLSFAKLKRAGKLVRVVCIDHDDELFEIYLAKVNGAQRKLVFIDSWISDKPIIYYESHR